MSAKTGHAYGAPRAPRRLDAATVRRVVNAVLAHVSTPGGLTDHAAALSRALYMPRREAAALLSGAALPMRDGRMARHLARALIDGALSSEDAAHRRRLLALAQECGMKAYLEARERHALDEEVTARAHAPRPCPGMHVAPFYSGEGKLLLMSVGARGQLIALTSTDLSPAQVGGSQWATLLECGVHYAPWRPADGVGAVLVAIDQRHRLVASMTVSEDAGVIPACRVARCDLETILAVVESAAPYHDPYDDGDDDDEGGAICGEGWKR